MKLSLLKTFKPLFVTSSGIQVKQAQVIVHKQNLLVKYHRTGQILLNNANISEAAYRRLCKAIEQQHPNACVYANAYQVVFIYPKLTPEW